MKRIKKFITLTISCVLVASSFTGCKNSKNDSSQKNFSAKTYDINTTETKNPQITSNPIYVIKSYNVYNNKGNIKYHYNFNYKNNKLTQIEYYTAKRLSATYLPEINDYNNLTAFLSFDFKNKKSEYYKTKLFNDGMLKCEYKYSPNDDIIYKYDFTYNDDKQIDTKTKYLHGTKQTIKSGYTYNKHKNIVQQTNYSAKGTAISYIKYYYKKGRLKTEKYFSKKGKIYYINKYRYNKKGKLLTLRKYIDKKCKKSVLTVKYKYNKKGLKTDEFRYGKNNKLKKHISIKYCKIKVIAEKPWYLDWVYDKISE